MIVSVWATGVVGGPDLKFFPVEKRPLCEYLLECCEPTGVVVPALLFTSFQRFPFVNGFYEVFAEVIPGEMS
mgnify:CR=1 FL=1